jgi:transposase-like protein
MDEEMRREAVAKAYGFQLYHQYGEEEAAHFLRKDHSTLKRWRRKGMVRFVNMGDRGVRYLGFDIADMILKGVNRE